jgi:NAD(P)-dependent dehydrogenase (short-subunit alcohol dehydrogenase family)
VRIEDRVFLVTGSGLGLVGARELVGQGCKVMLVDVNAEAGENAAASWARMPQEVRDSLGRVRRAGSAYRRERHA